MKSKKVEIEVTEGHNYHKDVNGGAPYTSVDYSALTYMGASPCNNEEEIQSAIKHIKEVIRDHGDIPVVNDLRKKATLSNWF